MSEPNLPPVADTGVTPDATGRAADPSRWGAIILGVVGALLASAIAWAMGADTAREIALPGLSALATALGVGELVRGTSTALTRAILGSKGAWSPRTVEREFISPARDDHGGLGS